MSAATLTRELERLRAPHDAKVAALVAELARAKRRLKRQARAARAAKRRSPTWAESEQFYMSYGI